jgi:peptide/nickel transport system substrate-binding protein
MKDALSLKVIYIVLAICLILFLALGCTANPTTSAPAASTTSKSVPSANTPSSAATAPTPTAAQSSPATMVPKPLSTTAAQYGGELNIIDTNSPRENLGYPSSPMPRFNPFLPYPCVELLLRLDEQGLPVPWLATDYKWSTDYKSLTLSLRKGVKFHDGTDFNAAAVKNNLDRFLPPSTRPELVNVSSIDVVDDYTVRLNCKVYDALVPVNLAAVPGCMVSPTSMQKNGQDWSVLHPVGTGPFKLDNYTRDVSLKLVKNNDYWQQGKPYLDRLTINFIADPVTAKASFLAGEGQVITSLNSMDASQYKKTGKYNIVSCQQSVAGVAFDSAHTDSPFGNLKVRQAVSYAIDSKSIVDAVGYGIMTVANQIANSKDWAYNPNVAGYPYNPQKAKQLLTEAGFPNGFNTKLTYATGNADLEALMLAIQRNLNDVGIKVEMDPVAAAKYSQVITGGWQNGMVAYTGFIDVGYPTLNTFLLNLQKRSANYVSFLRPDDLQAAVEAGATEPNQDKLTAIVYNLQSLLIDKYCIVKPVAITYRNAGSYPAVHDVRIFEPWAVHWKPENVWLSK